MHTVKISTPISFSCMKRKEFNTSQDIFNDLIDMWELDCVVSSYRPGHYYPNRIGQAVLRLTDDKRKILEQLTSDQIKDTRSPRVIANPSKMNISVFHIPHVKS